MTASAWKELLRSPAVRPVPRRSTTRRLIDANLSLQSAQVPGRQSLNVRCNEIGDRATHRRSTASRVTAFLVPLSPQQQPAGCLFPRQTDSRGRWKGRRAKRASRTEITTNLISGQSTDDRRIAVNCGRPCSTLGRSTLQSPGAGRGYAGHDATATGPRGLPETSWKR